MPRRLTCTSRVGLRVGAAHVMAAALLVVGVAGCGVNEDDAAPAESETSSEAGPAEEASEPERLRIDGLGLDEELIDLGLNDDRSLEVPQDHDRVGWFTGGGRPGGTGPTVLAGHVDSETGPAVFAELNQLQPGDEVAVTSADGTVTDYRVTEVEDVSYDRFPTEAVFGATQDDILRMITCTGAYDTDRQQYTANRIVHAEAV